MNVAPQSTIDGKKAEVSNLSFAVTIMTQTLCVCVREKVGSFEWPSKLPVKTQYKFGNY